MSIVAVESERFSNMERVAELKMKGYTDTAISREIGLPRKEVKELFDDYRTALSSDAEARDLARDHLHQMVKHYDSLIKKFYDLVDEIDTLDFGHQVAAQKNAALKAIAELEAKRLDALQKAGLLDSAELGDELSAMEDRMATFVDILQNDLCDSCRTKIKYKLSVMAGQAVGDVVEPDAVWETVDDDE